MPNREALRQDTMRIQFHLIAEWRLNAVALRFDELTVEGKQCSVRDVFGGRRGPWRG